MEKLSTLHEDARKSKYNEFMTRIAEAASEYYNVDANLRKLEMPLTREQDAKLNQNIAEKWEIKPDSLYDYVMGFRSHEEIAERETDEYFSKK